MVSNTELTFLTTTLSNLYDWDSDQLEADFISFAAAHCPNVSTSKLVRLFRTFDSLHVRLRDDPRFELEEFIRAHV